MDSKKEVVQKLSKLNIDPRAQTPGAAQAVNASHIPGPDQRPGPGPFSLTSQVGVQTQHQSTQFSLSNDKRTKSEAITAPFTANTSTDPESPKNVISLRKPFRNISRNLAESLTLAKGVKPRNSDDRPHTTSTSITKCHDRVRMGVVNFLRRDASNGLKRWLQEKERRHESTRRAARAHRRGAFSEGMRERLGLKLKREEASFGQLEVIKEEVEEDGEEDVKMEEDTVMAD